MHPHIIGYCYSAGGPTSHGAHAPIVATTNLSGITNEQCDFLYPKHEEKFDSVLQLNSQLAELVYFHLSQGHFPITLGGDHSCAIGTWSGVSRHAGGPIGLIFIDAHLDAHTPKTSPSRNLHGMSIAHLLGHGHTELTQISHDKPKISHQHLVYIGTRDYEQEEFDFIKALVLKYLQTKMLPNMVLRKFYTAHVVFAAVHTDIVFRLTWMHLTQMILLA